LLCLFHDAAFSWQERDASRLEIMGGRDGGFRADVVKSNYQPGRWRVSVETSDKRELGRIDLTVVEDKSTEAPKTWTIMR
jgi:hypothetical protein